MSDDGKQSPGVAAQVSQAIQKAGDRAMETLSAIAQHHGFWSAMKSGASDISTAARQFSDARSAVQREGVGQAHAVGRGQAAEKGPALPTPAQIARGQTGSSLGPGERQMAENNIPPDVIAQARAAWSASEEIKNSQLPVSNERSGQLSPTPTFGPNR